MHAVEQNLLSSFTARNAKLTPNKTGIPDIIRFHGHLAVPATEDENNNMRLEAGDYYGCSSNVRNLWIGLVKGMVYFEHNAL